MSLLVVAFARAHDRPAAVAWIEAALAAGSAAGGLAYGARAWRSTARARLALLAAALAGTVTAAGLAPSVPVLAIVIGVAGGCVAPTLTTAYLLADAAAAPDARTRAGARVNTAFNLGASAGTAAAGPLLDALPLTACFALAAIPAATAAATVTLPTGLPEQQQRLPEGGSGGDHRWSGREPATSDPAPRGATMTDDPTATTIPAEFWDARYAERDRIWSGDPNTVLVRETTALPPGTALDLGCGEGADAVWLAGRGWRVTATDVSRVALDRAARHAADAGVGDRVDLQLHDLATSFPTGTYDLVSAQFLHSPAPLPREDVLRAAAAAVAPGGTLLITGHAGPPPWEHDHEHDHHAVHLPTPDEVLASLRLPDGEWDLQLSEEHQRVQNDPDGNPVTRVDNVVKLRRRPT